MEYNGEEWTLFPSPNESIIRSVKVIGDKVYTGSFMDFGFWEKSDTGEMNYTSISGKLNLSLTEDEEFWGIEKVNEFIVFQSLRNIYIYNTETDQIHTLSSDERLINMFLLGENIFFQKSQSGVFQILNGQDSLFLDHAIFKKDEIVDIFQDGKDYLILTKTNGVYRYDGHWLTRVDGDLFAQFSNISIYSALRLKNGNYAIGTISNGLILVDENFKIETILNQSSGLINNTVLSIYEDADQNIWLGLDHGVSCINAGSPFRVYNDAKGILGSVYASAYFEDMLFLGTNQGLFYKPEKQNVDFQFLEGTGGQVWSLKVIDGQLFCGHHSGTLIIENTKIKNSINIPGVWEFETLKNNPNLILQGNYDGIYLLEKRNGLWQLRNKIEGFNNSARHLEYAFDKVFINHEYKGLYMLDIDEDFQKVVSLKVDTVLRGANSSVSKFQADVLFASKSGIYKYVNSIEQFVADSSLSKIFTADQYTSGKIIQTGQPKEFALFTKDNLILVRSGNLSNEPEIRKIPLAANTRDEVVEYENILTKDGDKYLIGTAFGYISFSLSDLVHENHRVTIKSIMNGVSGEHGSLSRYVDLNAKGSFSNEENNFQVTFYTASYSKILSTNYRYKLDGIYNTWSEWLPDSKITFENLPAGDYKLSIQSKIGNRISENTATYSFSISKPWYFTNFMIAMYVIGVVLFSIMMHNIYRKYYKTQEQKLIEKNKRELELTKLQNEKEIIKIKNHQLEKDVKQKSNELAASIMSLVKKNELLTEIKDQLTKNEEGAAIKSVVKIIDKNLDQAKNWELFKEAFENADQDFFKTLKEEHPNLSPNDMKLCAYLRLNLSSKEIAPLINISPRSVEIKRYRLRKKLNLESNENLTNYIMSL
ncbi:MAG: hypothetical protein Tsb0034_23740 [Ekhidna sp.]